MIHAGRRLQRKRLPVEPDVLHRHPARRHPLSCQPPAHGRRIDRPHTSNSRREVRNVEARPETDFKDLPLKPTAHAATYWRELAAVHDRVYDAGQNLVLVNPHLGSIRDNAAVHNGHIASGPWLRRSGPRPRSACHQPRMPDSARGDRQDGHGGRGGVSAHRAGLGGWVDEAPDALRGGGSARGEGPCAAGTCAVATASSAPARVRRCSRRMAASSAATSTRLPFCRAAMAKNPAADTRPSARWRTSAGDGGVRTGGRAREPGPLPDDGHRGSVPLRGQHDTSSQIDASWCVRKICAP